MQDLNPSRGKEERSWVEGSKGWFKGRLRTGASKGGFEGTLQRRVLKGSLRREKLPGKPLKGYFEGGGSVKGRASKGGFEGLLQGRLARGASQW